MTSAMILILTLNFPILDGDLTRSTSDGVFISQLIRFATGPSHVSDFNAHKMLNAKLFVPRHKSKGTIVMGLSVVRRPSVRPSILPSFRPSVRQFVDTILSPQLLLQFSRDFDETFQVLFP